MAAGLCVAAGRQAITRGTGMRSLLLVLAIATGPAFADEVYTGVGTTGVTLGVGRSVMSGGSARLEVNGLDYSRSYSSDGINYDARLRHTSAAGFYDWFPTRNDFRLTAGVFAGDTRLNGSSNGAAGTTYTLNGQTYSAAGESLSLRVKWPTVLPYLGVGWGHGQASRGLGFFADAGVAYGRPSVSLSASPGLTAQATQANIDAERQRIEDDVNKYRYLPVLRVGLSYSFQ